MSTDIKKLIHSKFEEFKLFFTNFFEIPADEQYDSYEFKAEIDHKNKTSEIEKHWNEQMLPLSIEVNNSDNADEIRFMITEFDSYYQYFVETYFGKDYRPHYKVGKNIGSKQFEQLSDNEKEWHFEAEPFLRQKNYLYDFLQTCKQQIKYPESLETGKLTINNLKEIPKTFKEVFKVEDWQTYIDPLVYMKLLDSNYNFVGNPHTDKAVVGSWFRTLRNELHVLRSDVGLTVLVNVINNELPTIDIKSHKSISDTSKRYNHYYKKPLLKYLGEKTDKNIPSIPK